MTIDEIHDMSWPMLVKECERYEQAPEIVRDICYWSHRSMAKPITSKQIDILRRFLEKQVRFKRKKP